MRPLLTTLGTFGTIVTNCLEILQKSIDSKSDLLAEFYGPKCAATFFNFQVVFYYECIFGLQQVPGVPPIYTKTHCKFSEDWPGLNGFKRWPIGLIFWPQAGGHFFPFSSCFLVRVHFWPPISVRSATKPPHNSLQIYTWFPRT